MEAATWASAETIPPPACAKTILRLGYLLAAGMQSAGKGQHFLDKSGPTDWFLGGWQTNGLLFTQSGLYFSPVLLK